MGCPGLSPLLLGGMTTSGSTRHGSLVLGTTEPPGPPASRLFCQGRENFLSQALYFKVSLFQQLSFCPNNLIPFSDLPRKRDSVGSLM